MMHTHALLDWDCWIDRNPHPGDCGRCRGPGHVLPGASVEEEEGVEEARRMGALNSQQTRQPWERKQAQSLMAFDLLCWRGPGLFTLLGNKHCYTEQALDSQQFLLLTETCPKALNICWGLCTKKRWQYVLLLIFLYTPKFPGLSNVYSLSAANLFFYFWLAMLFFFLVFLCNKI